MSRWSEKLSSVKGQERFANKIKVQSLFEFCQSFECHIHLPLQQIGHVLLRTVHLLSQLLLG